VPGEREKRPYNNYDVYAVTTHRGSRRWNARFIFISIRCGLRHTTTDLYAKRSLRVENTAHKNSYDI